jgi:hypothetical protein
MIDTKVFIMCMDDACTLIKYAINLNYKNIAEISRISIDYLNRLRNVRDACIVNTDKLERFFELHNIAKEIERRYGLFTITNPHKKICDSYVLIEGDLYRSKESIYECLISKRMYEEQIYSLMNESGIREKSYAKNHNPLKKN